MRSLLERLGASGTSRWCAVAHALECGPDEQRFLPLQPRPAQWTEGRPQLVAVRERKQGVPTLHAKRNTEGPRTGGDKDAQVLDVYAGARSSEVPRSDCRRRRSQLQPARCRPELATIHGRDERVQDTRSSKSLNRVANRRFSQSISRRAQEEAGQKEAQR